MSLCCNDCYGKYTMGNLNKQSILEVWNSDEFNAVREKITVGRGYNDICRCCDYFGFL
ncbi:MAG: SPASM domain-containing protein [Lachnospiraceae bacterium]|nr:SPASM domain-containing protein [Lachnospiraceae bacterium]